MRLALTMTHYARLETSRESLAAVLRARDELPRDLDVAMGLFIEPGHREVADLCRYLAPASTWIVVNHERLGVNRNTLRALDWAFCDRQADFVVHVEDDCVLAPDALRFFTWAAAEFRRNDRILTVTAYNRVPELPPSSVWHAVRARRWFHPWGWGTWADRYDAVIRDCFREPRQTYDCTINDWGALYDRYEVYPVLARVQNIGRVSTIPHANPMPPEWYDEHHRLKHTAVGRELPGGSFHVDGGAETG